MASKFQTGVMGWSVLAAVACGSPSGAPFFTKCEGTPCAGSSSGAGGLTSAGYGNDENASGHASAGPSTEPRAGATGGAASQTPGAAGGSGSVGAAGLSGSPDSGGPVAPAGAGSANATRDMNHAGENGGARPTNDCTAAVGSVSALSIYDGSDAACSLMLAAPRNGSWFGVDDGTSPLSMGLSVRSQKGGHSAAGCFVHGAGAGATDWGGGIGFSLNGSRSAPCPYDASAYRGISIYLAGGALATQGPNYHSMPNMVRVNAVTTATSDAHGTCNAALGKCNDHFGVWCTLGPGWSRCDLPFDNLSQRGWGAVEHFDKAKLLQIEILTVRDPDASFATSWDISTDDVAFYQ